ncbi:MAG: OmpA family protein [Bacteroidales bacterium]|nr:OmpA family protein [Bacteroidales bacterium]
MKMLKITALSLFVCLLVQPVEAQKRDRVALADKTFEIGEYFRAIEKYKKAYSKEKDKLRKTEITYKIAHCYRLSNDVKKAKAQYKRVIMRKYPDPKVYFYYAEMLKKIGDIEDAKEAYENYLKEVPDDELALKALSGCDSVLSWTANPTRYQIANIKDFNSRENDFSPAYVSEDYREVLFTSSREESEGNKVHGATGESFSDIFFTRLDNKKKWSVPVPLEKTISSMYDDGTPWISPDGSSMYFTRCRFDKIEELGCQVMVSKKVNNKWEEPMVIPLADDSVVVAHPSLTDDELTLFFVANLYGGYGGKDLWKVSRESAGGNWGEPDNLGENINTSGNEMFPFVKTDSLFYFSSNGHIGMGGLDIFKASLNDTGVWEVENMRYPINSEADDFGIVFQKTEEEGYFTSSRKEGARGGDDIYSFLLPSKKFSIAGLVLNEKDEMPLDSANVRLIGSEGTNLEYTTDSTGRFSFNLKSETDYIVVSVKRKFLNGKVRETTVGIPDSRDFAVTLLMAPIEKPVELPNILYDLAQWNLRPESMIALDGLVETLEDNPNITIELMSHTDVRPFRSMSNLVLSQNRAQSVVDYLINNGIDADRLKARGYGPEVPRVANEGTTGLYDFVAVGDTLNKEFIDALVSTEQQEIVHQLNRRTEFRVLSTDFVPRKLREAGMNADEQILEMGRKELAVGFGTDSVRNARRDAFRKKAAAGKVGKAGGGKKLP